MRGLPGAGCRRRDTERFQPRFDFVSSYQVNAFGDQSFGPWLVRFWATPKNEAVWSALYLAGVDLINADDLDALRRFLIRRRTR